MMTISRRSSPWLPCYLQVTNLCHCTYTLGPVKTPSAVLMGRITPSAAVRSSCRPEQAQHLLGSSRQLWTQAPTTTASAPVLATISCRCVSLYALLVKRLLHSRGDQNLKSLLLGLHWLLCVDVFSQACNQCLSILAKPALLIGREVMKGYALLTRA